MFAQDQVPPYLQKANLDADYEAVGRAPVVDLDYPTLEDALAATNPGGTLEIRRAWGRTTALTIDKAASIVFRGGSITLASNTPCVTVTADDVELVDPKLIGPGSSSTSATNDAIFVPGTVANPIRGLRILRPDISQFRHAGVWMDNCIGAVIHNPNIRFVGYGGIVGLSCIDCHAVGGTIEDVTQPTGYPNSYGVAWSRRSNMTLDESPHSDRCSVERMTVRRVLKWEGIDTHAGRNIRVVGNLVTDCLVGIAIVGCPDKAPGSTTGEGDVWAAKNVEIIGNVVDAGSLSGGAAQAGIKVVGAPLESNTISEYATGVVVGNTIRGYGWQNGLQGAFVAYVTQGLVVASNVVDNAVGTALYFYYSNLGFSCIGNTMIDTYTDTGAFTAAVFLRSNDNYGSIVGNAVVRGDKVAAHVNQRGLYITAALGSEAMIAGNDFTKCAIPVNDTNSLTTDRLIGKRAGFYGVTPVARQAIAPAATDAATTQTLVNDLRTKLRNLGLLS